MAKIKSISNGFSRYADDGTDQSSLGPDIVAAPTGDVSNIPTVDHSAKCNGFKNLFHIGNCPDITLPNPDKSIDTTTMPQQSTSQFDAFLNSLIATDKADTTSSNSAQDQTNADDAAFYDNLSATGGTPAGSSASTAFTSTIGFKILIVVGILAVIGGIYLIVRKRKQA